MCFNNTTCEFLLPVEFDSYGIAAVTAHLFTASVIFIMAKRLYQRAEISHPLFALAFQELVIILICQLTGLCFLLSTMIKHDAYLYGTFIAIGSVAAHVHQMTWLCITTLRYYLLVHIKESEHIDFARLRRLTMLAFWLLSLVPVPGLQFVLFSIIDRVFNKVIIDDELFIVRQGLLIIMPYNIPDITSFLIYSYLAMGRHFKRKVMLQSRVPIEPYGGILVGEVLDEIPPINDNDDGLKDVKWGTETRFVNVEIKNLREFSNLCSSTKNH